MCGDQHAPARVDVKCPAVDAARIDVLDEGRLAGAGVYLVDGKRILAACKHGPSLTSLVEDARFTAYTKLPFGWTCTVPAICRPRMSLGRARVSLRNAGAADSAFPEISNMSSLFCRSSVT